MLANVSVSDGNGPIIHNARGNLEYGQFQLQAAAAPPRLKRGAVYTATDGATVWKIMYDSFLGGLLNFNLYGG